MSTNAEQLADFIKHNQPLVVITGAGCSEASGIPTYRDDNGVWLRTDPIQHQEFMSSERKRQRYWTRSFGGWPFVAKAAPNASHESLCELEQLGFIKLLVTQNVDRLHQRSGHKNVIDLHGRLDQVHCVDCHMTFDRAEIQNILAHLNPHLASAIEDPKKDMKPSEPAPDGDADVSDKLVEQTRPPHCSSCGGLLKPSVVFYGGGVEKSIVHNIYDQLERANGLLAIGTSLMVFSSFRFCRYAAKKNKPIALLNAGKTRADDLADIKLTTPSQQVLPEALTMLRKLL